MNDLDEASELLRAAERDVKPLKGTGDPGVFADEIFGFHAQLAIEKSLKAWLCVLGKEYPPIRDVGRLLRMLADLGQAAAAFRGLARYDVFAVERKYQGIDENVLPLDRALALAEASRVFDLVRRKVEEGRVS